MYIYESHLGRFFWTEEMLTYDETYCETCGDSDSFLGCANNKEEAWDLLKDMTDREMTPEDECYEEGANTGGYDRGYVEEFINSIPF